MNSSVSHREYLFPLALGMVFAVLGTFPYLYGYATAPEGKAFMGFVGRGTPGLNGYLMLAKQVQEGAHLMENKATPEPRPRNYPNLEWWTFGMVARLTGLSLILVFHLDRVFTCFLFCFAAYYLSARCLPTPGWRRLAVALMVFGSGLGWVLLLATRITGIDLPPSFDWPSLDLQGVSLFNYLMNQPHFVRAAACAALAYAFLLDGARTGKMRYFVFSGLAALAHSSIRPYHIIELHLVYALFPVLMSLHRGRFQPRLFLGCFVAALVHLPGVGYYVWLAVQDSLGIDGVRRQSRFLLSTVLWLGLPFLLCAANFVVTGAGGLRATRPAVILMGLWLALAWLIVNTFPFFVLGHEAAFGAYTIAPALLICAGPLPRVWSWLQDKRPSVRPMLWATLLVAVCMPSSVYAYARVFTDMHHPIYPQHYYLEEGTLSAMRWLQQHSQPGDVVLASHDVLQYVPRFSHNKVVTFHDLLTAKYYEKTAQVKQFFENRGDNDFKLGLVKRYDVGYVIYGPEEREEGAMNPGDHPWLRLVFQAGQTQLYRVER